MNQDIPKQFFHVYDKPLIIYTLEAFQKNPNIDAIQVVLLEGWEFILNAYIKQYNITKFVGVSNGGQSGQESIFNGIKDLELKYGLDDIVIVHDGNRPMVSNEMIDDCIKTCLDKGNATAAIPTAEAVLIRDEVGGGVASAMIERQLTVRTQTPQAYKLKDILSAHDEANQKGIKNTVATCTLFIELNRKVYFSKGSEKNIKLTTIEDLEIFKALLDSKKMEWLK